MSKKQPTTDPIIATNSKAYHDYHIEERFEAGLALEGWEVKSLRAGKVQLRDSYVILKNGEAWLIGAHISTLITTSAQTKADPTRSRKLLLNQRELSKLFQAVQRQGHTVVALNLHWKRQYVKVDIAIASGKKQHDKRETIKQREWNREKHRVLKR